MMREARPYRACCFRTKGFRVFTIGLVFGSVSLSTPFPVVVGLSASMRCGGLEIAVGCCGFWALFRVGATRTAAAPDGRVKQKD